MNKAMKAIADAVTSYGALRTKLYKVTEGGLVYYRGSLVADVSVKVVKVNLCGWPTATTRKVINAALAGAERAHGGKYPTLSQVRFQTYVGGVPMPSAGWVSVSPEVSP